MAGIVAALRGSAADSARPTRSLPVRAGRPHHTSVTHRYCTSFAVTGHDLDPRASIVDLEAIGDSVLVVGDAATLKVHLHTDDPDAATALFAGVGEVSHLVVADMSEQVARHTSRLVDPEPSRLSGLLALADGEGLRELFEGFGARVLGGSRTPSTAQLLAAIHGVEADEVVLLPNRPDALNVARRAAELSEVGVVVVATASPQAGLAAAAVHGASHGAAENATAMTAAVARLRTGSVAPAPADDPEGHFRAGDALGVVDAELVASGEVAATLREVLARLSAGAEVVTCLSGADPPLDDAAVGRLAAGSAPLTQSVGGQRAPWWLLSAQ
jgi:hypothetical protein